MTGYLPDDQLRNVQRLVASPRLPERPSRSLPEGAAAAHLGGYTLTRPLGLESWEANHSKHPGRLVVRIVAKDPSPDRLLRFVGALKRIAKLPRPVFVPNQRLSRAGPFHFLVREWIPGKNLTAWKGTPREGLLAFYQLARSLQLSHEQGMAGGDLTAHNVILDDAGSPYIVDFALHRLCRALSGRPEPDPDPAVDASDLGTIFLTLVSGRPVEEILTSSAPPPLPSIDSKVDSQIRSMASRILNGKPAPTARDLADAAAFICQKLPGTGTGRIDLLDRYEQKMSEQQ
jgi:serine/threonine protein kinase